MTGLCFRLYDPETVITVEPGPVLHITDGSGRATIITLPKGEMGDTILSGLREELNHYLRRKT